MDDRRTANDTQLRYLDLMRACDQPVIVCTLGLIRVINDGAVGVLGATRPEQLLSRPIRDFVDLSDVPPTDPAAAPVQPVEVALQRLDGAETTICVVWMPCRYDGCDGVQIVMRDVSARRSLERQVQFLTRHDDLTKMPNRIEFRDRLAAAIGRAQRSGRLVGVMALNIDRMREVNATHGHHGGDLALQAVAARILASIRQADTAARVGADEFAMILEGLEQRSHASVVANRVLAAIHQPVDTGTSALSLKASAGIAAYPGDGEDLETLLRAVDVAMFAMKTAGGDGFRFYFREMETVSRRDDARRQQILARIALLTPREREVMDMLVAGNTNKATGYLLGASPRTIESHRAHVMHKLEAESLPDLVRMVLEVGDAK